jgi:hypothetical protein
MTCYWLLMVSEPHAGLSVWESPTDDPKGPMWCIHTDPGMAWMKGKSRSEVRKWLIDAKARYVFKKENFPDD